MTDKEMDPDEFLTVRQYVAKYTTGNPDFDERRRRVAEALDRIIYSDPNHAAGQRGDGVDGLPTYRARYIYQASRVGMFAALTGLPA